MSKVNPSRVNEFFEKAIKELAKKAGLDNTFFRKHLKKMLDEGHFKKSEDGYCVAK